MIRGWYIATAPGEKDGDTTAWHASSRDFIGAYCNERFGSEWCLSAESSLLIHAGVTVLPSQIIILATKARRNVLKLLGDSSQLVRLLLQGEHSFIAGRLAAAFRAIGQPRVANDIAGAMTAAGYRVDELNPFASRWSPFSPERMPEQSSIVTTADGIAL